MTLVAGDASVMTPDGATGDGRAAPVEGSVAEAGGGAGDAGDAGDAAPVVLPVVSARASSSCGVNNGAVKCWGSDDDGQLDMTMTDRSSATGPYPASDLGSGALSVAVGTSHVCALLVDGAVECWGSNANGQVGSDAGSGLLAPTKVALGQPATAIAASESTSCAILEDKSVVCWGDNTSGQLGDGDKVTTMSSAPVAVSGIANNAISLTAGELHFCALTGDRSGQSVQCWGWNHWNQIDGDNIDNVYTPYMVTGLPQPITAVAAGDMHTCALADKGVYCWGANNSGQLGDGTTTQSGKPAGSPVFTDAIAITAGTAHTCAVTSGGLYCWGDNTLGQLGDGNDGNIVHAPPAGAAIVIGSDIVSVAAGGNHTCAVLGGGGADCWGEDTDGQLGTGTTPVTKDDDPAAVVSW